MMLNNSRVIMIKKTYVKSINIGFFESSSQTRVQLSTSTGRANEILKKTEI